MEKPYRTVTDWLSFKWPRGLFTMLLALAAGPALAAAVLGISPQGETRDVRQIVIRFDSDMVPLGRVDAAPPAIVGCFPRTPEGRGRWVGPRVWSFEFARDLPSGLRCVVVFSEGLKALGGELVAKAEVSHFFTGPPRFYGPFPSEGVLVSENQIFQFQHDLPIPVVGRATYAMAFACEIRLGDAIQSSPMVLIDDTELARQSEKAPPAPYVLALRCATTLPEGAQLRIRYTPEGGAAPQLFIYRTHPPFTVAVSCTRIDQAGAAQGCDARRPVDLVFSQAIDASAAAQLRLIGADGTVWPFEAVNIYGAATRAQQFRANPPPASFGENSVATLTIAPDLHNLQNRPLSNAAEFPRALAFVRLLSYLGAANPLAVMPLRAAGVQAVAGFAVRRVEPELSLQHWRLGGEGGADMETQALELWQAWQYGQGAGERFIASLGPGSAITVATQGAGMEFVGLALAEPGLHIVRAQSPAFARHLDATRRSGDPVVSAERHVLVQATNLNLSAKLSAIGPSLVWVTALDSALPLPGAELAIYSCARELLWRGITNSQGLADLGEALRGKFMCNDPAAPPAWQRFRSNQVWLVARAGRDMALMQAAPDWSQHTEAWGEQSIAAHTVLDRSLFKAGEKVSMQHHVRILNSKGFAIPPGAPLEVQIRYGFGEIVARIPVGLSASGDALSSWAIPPDAKLGGYRMTLSQAGQHLASAEFLVEEFRTPVFDGRLEARTIWQGTGQTAQLDASLRYFAGGAAANQAVSYRHSLAQQVQSPREGYRFFDESSESARTMPPSIAPQEAKLDAQGGIQTKVAVPPLERPYLLQSELRFLDPNGEAQTLGAATMLWPDKFKLGLRVQPMERGQPAHLQGIALDANNQPLADEPVVMHFKPVRREWSGGRSHIVDLGPEIELCSARSDANGQWRCALNLPPVAGATGRDASNDSWLFTASADSLKNSVKPVRIGLLQSRWELGWRSAAAENVLLIENGPSFKPGDTAVLLARPQRLPASLLLTTEREGVMGATVYALSQLEQRIELPIVGVHAPNVHVVGRYVYSMQEAETGAQVASVQSAEIVVAPDAHRLSVKVQVTAAARPRAQLPVAVAVHGSTGQPVQGAHVTLVAVDQALLSLRPNRTWALAAQMLRRRSNQVQSSAHDNQLARRLTLGAQPLYQAFDESGRSFGAAPAPAPAPAAAMRRSVEEPLNQPPRSDLSSLILWRADLVTDAQGMARAVIPLNDALTQFRIVAIASAGAGQFGEGESTLTSTQPLQIFSGLPQLVRGDDSIEQKISLRNTGTNAIDLTLKAAAEVVPHADWPPTRAAPPPEALKARGLVLVQRLSLAPGQAKDVLWKVAVPSHAKALRWRISAQGGGENDVLEIEQRVVPALPVTVRQASLHALNPSATLPVAQPPGSVPGQGGLRVDFQASLVNAALAESTRWMAQYPYTCLEQLSSRLVALNDKVGWSKLMADLPKYIDSGGLARFFPESSLQGSEMLTMHLLDVAHAMQWQVPDAPKRQMLNALERLIEGRLAEQDWAPEAHLLPRQLAAQATLSEHGRARLLARPVQVSELPAQSLIDWTRALLAAPSGTEREREVQEAGRQLRNRYDVQGTRLRWRDEAGLNWWWFMWSADSSAARAALLAQRLAEQDETWRIDAPLITQGLVGRQREGRWSTTVGNVWSTVALRRFQDRFEDGAVTGLTHVGIGANQRQTAWSDVGLAGSAPSLMLPWPAAYASQSQLRLRHEGQGSPWATVSALAAQAPIHPASHGLSVLRTVTPIEQKRKGQWSVGDVMRVRLDMESSAAQSWVVVRDAVPSGATQLGRGLGRDSALASQGESRAGWAWPSYIERATESFRAYYRWVPRGRWSVEYTIRLNNVGKFGLPPVRVEAMYAPEVFGEGMAQTLTVK